MAAWIIVVVCLVAAIAYEVVGNAARAQSAPASLTGQGNGWPLGARDDLIEAFGAPSPEGRWGRLVAVERATGETVGFSSISNVDPPEIWSVGVIMSPAKRGQGFAAELLEATFAFAHASGIPVVYVGTATANNTMQAAIDQAGGVLSPTAPHTLPDGSVVESHWFVHCSPRTLRQSA